MLIVQNSKNKSPSLKVLKILVELYRFFFTFYCFVFFLPSHLQSEALALCSPHFFLPSLPPTQSAVPPLSLHLNAVLGSSSELPPQRSPQFLLRASAPTQSSVPPTSLPNNAVLSSSSEPPPQRSSQFLLRASPPNAVLSNWDTSVHCDTRSRFSPCTYPRAIFQSKGIC